MQQAVDAARANLPTDFLAPSVSEQDPSQAPVMDVAVESPVLSPREHRRRARQPHPAGVARDAPGWRGDVEGEPSRQFTVVPRSGALDAAGSSALDVVSRRWRPRTTCSPAGGLRSRVRRIVHRHRIGVARRRRSARASGRHGSAGGVRVGDVAGVVDGYADPSTLARVDGGPAVVLLRVARGKCRCADDDCNCVRERCAAGGRRAVRSLRDAAHRRTEDQRGDRRRTANAR